MSEGATTLRETIEKDGLLLLRNVLDPALVKRANQEVEALLRTDIEERKNAQKETGRFEGTAGKSIVDNSKQILLDIFAKSPTLDGLAEQLLTDPRLAELVEQTVGKNFKLRGYNIRHMTGEADNSAMEWHRDNRGEFNFAILLNESDPTGDAATCYIPGSHLYPYCPFQTIHLASPYAAYHPKMGVFSRRLARSITKRALAAHGGPGDVYLFIGDIWHGRQPNLRGNTGTVLFFAVFPSEIAFPSHSTVEIPPADVMEKLPPGLRKIVAHTSVLPNHDRSAYLYRMEKRRKKAYPFTLWHLAKVERWLRNAQGQGIVLDRLNQRLLPLKQILKPIIEGAWRNIKRPLRVVKKMVLMALPKRS